MSLAQTLICGVDEAGRGPLAGSVYAAAVILDPNKPIQGLADSKTISEKKRDGLAIKIKENAMAWAIASCSAKEIDQINILQASLLAMKRAVELMIIDFNLTPELVQVDGNKCPPISLPCEAIVKGDSKVQAISAASILAKTARDAELYDLDKMYPQYGFAQHKGYPSQQHLKAIQDYGICPEHRLTFGPVRKYLSSQGSC